MLYRTIYKYYKPNQATIKPQHPGRQNETGKCWGCVVEMTIQATSSGRIEQKFLPSVFTPTVVK
ncbi:hypothetical protein OK32_001222 [Salmonella enterica subsp. enterica]|nr:hypothetical protein [Salmonella enterica subsp. enterica serovar Hvittingfoss]